jgi:trigger factor
LKSQVAVVDVSEVKKDLTIEVAAEEVRNEFEKTYAAYSQYARVPGFRQGKVPRNLVKQRFGKDVKEEVLSRLLPHALGHAIEDHKFHVVGEPQIQDLSFEEGAPLRFKAVLEVIPNFEVQEYKGLKATKRIRQVTAEDVEQVLNRWREQSAEFVTIEDRPSQLGDFVSINLAGKYVETPEEEDLKAEDVQIELGAEGVQPEFNENLTGVKEGDVREFRVSYPEDFTSKGLAGKTLDFTASVVAVRQKELPELDDEFAQQFGEEYQTIQQLRDKVREDLVKSAESEADFRLRDELMDKLLEAYEFPVPDVLVEQQAQDRLRNFIYRLANSGLPPEASKNINWEERLGEARVMAVRDVRAALVVGRISEREKIRVTSDEIDAEIVQMAAGMRMLPAQLKARLTKEDELPSIENRLRYNKVIDLLVAHAKVTVEEATAEQLAQEAKAKQEAAAPAAENSPAE